MPTSYCWDSNPSSNANLAGPNNQGHRWAGVRGEGGDNRVVGNRGGAGPVVGNRGGGNRGADSLESDLGADTRADCQVLWVRLMVCRDGYLVAQVWCWDDHRFRGGWVVSPAGRVGLRAPPLPRADSVGYRVGQVELKGGFGGSHLLHRPDEWKAECWDGSSPKDFCNFLRRVGRRVFPVNRLPVVARYFPFPAGGWQVDRVGLWRGEWCRVALSSVDRDWDVPNWGAPYWVDLDWDASVGWLAGSSKAFAQPTVGFGSCHRRLDSYCVHLHRRDLVRVEQASHRISRR